MHRPTVGPYGGAVSYERGTPVGFSTLLGVSDMFIWILVSFPVYTATPITHRVFLNFVLCCGLLFIVCHLYLRYLLFIYNIYYVLFITSLTIPYLPKRWSHWHVSLGKSPRIRI